MSAGASSEAAPRRAHVDGAVPSRPVRLLTFTTLFPHAGRPNHGIFVENRLRHLLETGEAASTVVAPVPWFPSRSARFGGWAKHAPAGGHEVRQGFENHPPPHGRVPPGGVATAPRP